VVCDRTRLAGQFQAPEIERLGHQHVSSGEQQLARFDIGGVGIGGHDEPAIVGVERGGVDALLIGLTAQG
jgi:hypothetical protein